MTPNPPLFPSLRDAHPRRDLVAGVTLMAIAIPEQLATAQLAGVPAAQGLIVFAVAALVMLVVTRDRALSVGADSTIAPLIAATLAASGAVPGDAALLAGMVGLGMLAIYALRLEWVAELLSKAVAAGMLAGIAVHILVGRLPTALGLPAHAGSPTQTLRLVLGDLSEIRFAPLAMALGVAGLAMLGARANKRFPAALLALIGAVGVAAVMDPQGALFPRVQAASGSVGLAFPDLSAERAVTLLPTALSVLFLCLSQTTIVLQTGGQTEPAARRNAFGAIGMANLAVAAIGGFGVNSSPPRTQLLREAGARSQLAGGFAALVGLALIWTGAGLIERLPAAALAGILVFIALHLLGAARLRDLMRRSPSEGLIALATFALVIGLPLNSGLPLAILLSLVYASLPLFQSDVVELRNVPGTSIWWHRPEGAPGTARDWPEVLVLGLTSPVNFANVASIVARIRERIAEGPAPRLVVLECAGVLAVDLSGADRLGDLVEDLRGKGISVAMARLESAHAQRDLDRSGFLERLGRDNFFQSVSEAVTAWRARHPEIDTAAAK